MLCVHFLPAAHSRMHLCKSSNSRFETFIFQPASDYAADVAQPLDICSRQAYVHRPMTILTASSVSCLEEAFQRFGYSNITGKPLTTQAHGIYLAVPSPPLGSPIVYVPQIYRTDKSLSIVPLSHFPTSKIRILCQRKAWCFAAEICSEYLSFLRSLAKVLQRAQSMG